VNENSTIAELLAQEAEKATYPTQRALRRAARRAFLWEVEAADLSIIVNSRKFPFFAAAF